MPWLTIEVRSLPPPSIVNRNLVWLGFLGYLTAITSNGIRRLPALRAGVHRQLLMTTVGIYIGYFLTKNDNYQNARKDHEMFQYIRQHFKKPERKTMAEVLEDWVPIR